jgi:hypothetical protein
MRYMVSIASITIYPIPPCMEKLDPRWLIGWYSSAPMASRSTIRCQGEFVGANEISYTDHTPAMSAIDIIRKLAK